MEYRKAFANGLRLAYQTAGEGPPMVLLHGYPETSRMWRHVAPSLAERFTVIAPDYRGAGRSDRPAGGYDKRTMARDVHELVRSLGHDSIVLVGHDIGLMIAYAYASQFPEEVSRLVVLDAPLPGTDVFDRLMADSRLWHMPFHRTPDVPEFLTAGRERGYLSTFFTSKTLNGNAFSEADIDHYAAIYATPGGMRAGFEVYRALAQDIEENRAAKATKLKMPVLAMGGVGSAGEQMMREMMLEVAETVEAHAVPGSGHYVAEENPQFVATRILEWLDAQSDRP
jgi:pimeloyl-ACP methyl ester carboxylesterase